MTKNRFDEAIYWLNEAIEYGEERHNAPYEEAIQALEEIQQYRELGTVEHIKLTFELCKGLDAMAKMYEAIGTVDEFKALKEKNEPRKPTDISKVRDNEGYIGLIGKCPLCGEILEEDTVYCDCGQKIDWQ